MNWSLRHALATTLDNEFQPDFVANWAKPLTRLKGCPSKRKETGHWVSCTGQWQREQGGNAAVQPSQETPIVRSGATVDIARANHKIGTFLQAMQHFRYGFGRMTEIGIHTDEDIALCATHAVQHGLTKPAITCANDHLKPFLRASSDEFRRPIVAIVIHENEVEIQTVLFPNLCEPLDKPGKTFDLSIRGNDHRAAH